jgi:hypothetical protein
MSEPISRRDFLRKAGITFFSSLALGAGTGTLLAKVDDAVKEGKIGLGEEEKRKLEEIRKYRKSVGLDGLPSDFESILQKNNEWKSGGKFTNNLPVKVFSYGMYIEETTSEIFGKRSTVLVKGCKSDFANPGGIFFDIGNRFCGVSPYIRQIPLDAGFADTVLHECIGHGSDPDVANGLYPPKEYIAALHGKWKALSQMFSVPGEFLNHPNDKMYPMLKRRVGEQIGKSILINKNFDQIIKSKGGINPRDEINNLASKMGQDINSLKFNKKVCKTFGQFFIEKLLNQNVEFADVLNNVYQTYIEYVGREIYAEMIRHSVLHSDQVNNKIIFEGISESLEAASGKHIELNEIRDVLKPSKKVIDRYQAESKALQDFANEAESVNTQNANKTNANNQIGLTNSDLQKLEAQEKLSDTRMSDFDAFMLHGIIPSTVKIPEEYKEAVYTYASLCSQFNVKYPGVIDIDIVNDDSYDPDVNLWDLEVFASAYDPEFIRNLLMSSEVSASVNKELVTKNEILTKFMDEQIDLNNHF